MDNTVKGVEIDPFRKKLIAMVNNAIDARTGQDLAERIADHFIANGGIIPVRCKDCIHWYEPESVCLKIYSDGAVSPYAWQDRNPEDFCSYGERKDNAM